VFFCFLIFPHCTEILCVFDPLPLTESTCSTCALCASCQFFHCSESSSCGFIVDIIDVRLLPVKQTIFEINLTLTNTRSCSISLYSLRLPLQPQYNTANRRLPSILTSTRLRGFCLGLTRRFSSATQDQVSCCFLINDLRCFKTLTRYVCQSPAFWPHYLST
jgi:hypothetical protein